MTEKPGTVPVTVHLHIRNPEGELRETQLQEVETAGEILFDIFILDNLLGVACPSPPSRLRPITPHQPPTHTHTSLYKFLYLAPGE